MSPPAAAQPAREGGFLSVPDAAPGAFAEDDGIEPEVTITETPSERITEYRVRGRLYMVRVEPAVGAPYFLLDTNGDGVVDVQDERTSRLAIPQWLLFSW